MAYYTDLEDIKRVLRSSDKEVVRFSESLSEVVLKGGAEDISAPLGFNEEYIEYEDSFKDKKQFRIIFKSSTEFDIYEETGRHTQVHVVDQDQSINDDYTIPSGEITIRSDAWFGTIEDGNEVVLKFDPHISNEHAERYIEDVEVEIDSVLTAAGLDRIDEDEDRLFEEGEVPPQIEVASTYLSAYYIFTDVFTSVYQDGSPEKNYSGRWKSRAEKYIKKYIKTQGLVAPRAMAFPKFIDKIGVPDIGPGMDKMIEDDEDFARDAKTKDIFKNSMVTDKWS